MKLQQLAKMNHLGCIWSGVTRNYLFDQVQRDESEDVGLRPLMGFNRQTADGHGFPLKYQSQGETTRFAPWHERELKKKLEKGRRTDYQEHQRLPCRVPYGIQIEMEYL